jgi:hypothetical protein
MIVETTRAVFCALSPRSHGQSIAPSCPRRLTKQLTSVLGALMLWGVDVGSNSDDNASLPRQACVFCNHWEESLRESHLGRQELMWFCARHWSSQSL